MAKYFVSWEGKVRGLSHVEASSEDEAVLKFRDNPDHHKVRFLTGVFGHMPEDVIPEYEEDFHMRKSLPCLMSIKLVEEEE